MTDAFLTGSRVLITGGAGGVGRETAARMLAAGARVGDAQDRAARPEDRLARDRLTLNRHCEERSDEAIQSVVQTALDCFASLAITSASTYGIVRYRLTDVRSPQPESP